MTKSEVTTAVFNGAPAWGALAWSKLMRRKVGKSQLQFIKTVSIYINLTQTVTNTGNVPSFHPTRRGYASAATVRRRRLVDKARLRRGRPVRSRRAPSSQPRVARTVRLPLANTRSILNHSPLLLVDPLQFAYRWIFNSFDTYAATNDWSSNS